MPIVNGRGRAGIRKSSAALSIVTNGLKLHLDAGNPASYPGTGTLWTDLSGNGNNGTLTNGPTYNSSNGGSIVFDGSNDYVNLLSNASTSVFALQSFTLDIWIKPTTVSGDRNLWSVDFTSYANPYYSQHMRMQGRSIFVGGNINGNYDGGMHTNGDNNQSIIYLLTANTVYNITWVREFNTNKHNLYVNGQFICSKVLSAGSITYYNAPVRFGNSYIYSSTFQGNYHNLKYYNRPLSSSEVTQNYNALKSRFGL